MHLSLLSFALLPLAYAAPIPAPVAPKANEAVAITSGPDANTGLASLLGNKNLTEARLEVASGLKDMSSALSTISGSANGDLATLATSATSDVSRAQQGVDDIGKNILEGVDPNTGNNPQGQVAAGIVAANKTVGQIAATKGVDANALSELQSGLASAIKGGDGVLAAQGKSLNDVLGANGEPLPTSSSSSASTGSASTDDAASSSSSGAGGLLGALLGGLKRDATDSPSSEKRADPLAGLLSGLTGGAAESSSSGAASGGGLAGLLGGLTGGATGSSTSADGSSADGSSSAAGGGLAGLLGGLTGGAA